MINIYLIRHGQTVSNAGIKAMPNAEVYLTDLGHQQAEDLAEWLQHGLPQIDDIYVSKFLRTQQTAEPLLKALGNENIIDNQSGEFPKVIEGLEEFDYLSLERMLSLPKDKCNAEVESFWQTFSADMQHGDTAESFANFCARVEKVQIFFATLPTGNHVVYTHGLWISMLIWQMLGQPCDTADAMQKFRQFELSIRARNCEVFRLTLDENLQKEDGGMVNPSITKVRTCADAPLDAHLLHDK